jgi:hypothetical protein
MSISKDKLRTNLRDSLHAAIQIWAALAIGIIVASILATSLTVAGVSKNNSLMIAFLVLIGCSLLGLTIAPQSLLKMREGIHWRKSVSKIFASNKISGADLFRYVLIILAILFALACAIIFVVTNNFIFIIALAVIPTQIVLNVLRYYFADSRDAEIRGHGEYPNTGQEPHH